MKIVYNKLLLSFLSLAFLININGFSQATSDDVAFRIDKKRVSPTEIEIKIVGKPVKGVKLYALQKSDGDALYSSIEFNAASLAKPNGKTVESGNLLKEIEPSVEAEVAYFSDSAIWVQKFTIGEKDSAIIKGAISYTYKKGEEILAEEEEIKVYVRANETEVAAASDTKKSEEGKGITEDKSLWWIFLTGFGGGLLALIMPCIYSMIPITVSFFTKRSKTRKQGIKNALIYSLSIISIFTLFGLLISIIFGPEALNALSTNWIANLFFFVLFVVFGFSFLGAFEIALPASWSTKADSKANQNSLGGIFFMALTLVVVSFSCTAPIIGNLITLVGKGDYWSPTVGFFGFSLALSIPFALFAFFPSALNALGKSGGWLNAVKVTLGFAELALAMKFLSNADLAKNWRILDREIFLAVWIVLFFLLGLYLLGKIKFHHDDELPKNDYGLPYLTVTRLCFAISSFVLVMYMIPGMWGAPLKGLSQFLPPMGTQEFNSSGGGKQSGGGAHAATGSDLPHPSRYVGVMKIHEPSVVVNNGLVAYFDYNEALEVAKKANKPLMLDFTGINCQNCRKMESGVWSDPEVMKRLKENFVIASLYVDAHDGVDLPEAEVYKSTATGKKIDDLGERNTDLQITKFGANVQPYYFFLDLKEQRLISQGYGYDPDVKKFIALLDKAVEEFKKR